MRLIHGLFDPKLEKGETIYVCQYCANMFNWDENSSWYGSLKQMDDGEDLVYCCGREDCQIELSKLYN